MKKLLLTTLALMLLLTVSRHASAQTGVVRLEFPAEIGKTPYEIIPLEKSGLLFFNALDDVAESGNRNWHFAQYDTNLVKIWEARVPVLNGATFEKCWTEGDKVFLFFINLGKVKGGADNYQLSELELSSGIINHFTGILPDIYEIKGFIVKDDIAVLACDTEEEQAAVYFIDFRSRSVSTYLSDQPDQNFVEDLRYDEKNRAVLLLTSNYLSRKQNNMRLISLDLKARLLKEVPVQAVLPSKFLNSARICPIDGNNIMVVGAYGNFASKIPGSTEYFGIESAGFFVTRFQDNVQQFMNYYSFLELQNLRNTISARDYMKLSR